MVSRLKPSTEADGFAAKAEGRDAFDRKSARLLSKRDEDEDGSRLTHSSLENVLDVRSDGPSLELGGVEILTPSLKRKKAKERSRRRVSSSIFASIYRTERKGRRLTQAIELFPT